MHTTPTAQPPKLLDQIRDKLRIKHYAIRTEEQYLHWIKRFILFHGKRNEVQEREFSSSAARAERARGIEKVLLENVTPDLLSLLAVERKHVTYTYSYKGARQVDESCEASLSIWEDGLRHSKVRGSFWKGLASLRQVARVLAEHGITPSHIENWLAREFLPPPKVL